MYTYSRQTKGQRERQRDTETDRGTYRQTEGHIDRQRDTDRGTQRQTDGHIQYCRQTKAKRTQRKKERHRDSQGAQRQTGDTEEARGTQR